MNKNGSSTNQYLGWISDISDDGSKIIYGDTLNRKVYIGTYNDTDYTEAEILESTESNFGKYVSISGDGNTIAVGNFSSFVHIYKLINGVWTFIQQENFIKARFNYNASRMITK